MSFRCINRGIVGSREVALLLDVTLVRPIIEYCIQFCYPHFQMDVETLDRCHRVIKWQKENAS